MTVTCQNLVKMYTGPEDIGAVVADVGSFATRIGFAGDDCPKAYFPTAVGHDEGGFHFNLSKFRENMEIRTPVRDGVVQDWDTMEKIWEYACANYLKSTLKDAPVLLSEKPYNVPNARHRNAELMFERFGTSAMFLSKDVVLSCYACGKTSGLVVDVGASGTIIAPVSDGWVDTKGLNRCIVGGRVMDAHVYSLFKKQGIINPKPLYKLTKVAIGDNVKTTDNPYVKNIHPSYETYMNLELTRDYKESMSRIAESTLSDDPRFLNLPLLYYELPDGTVVDVGIERFQCTELLMNPLLFDYDGISASTLYNPFVYSLHNITNSNSINSSTSNSGNNNNTSGNSTTSTNSNNNNLLPLSKDGVPKLIQDSVIRNEVDVQTMLLANMVLTGGGASVEGMPERIRTEVEKLVHPHAPGWKIKILAAGSNERALCTWLGGSILASLGSYHEMWISKQEYDEYGGQIVDRKCP